MYLLWQQLRQHQQQAHHLKINRYKGSLRHISFNEKFNVTSQTGKVAEDPAVANRWYENGVAPNGGFIRVTVQDTVPEDVGNDWMQRVFEVDANQFVEANIHQTIY